MARHRAALTGDLPRARGRLRPRAGAPLIWALLHGCAPHPRLEAEATPRLLQLASSCPFDRVQVRTADGALLVDEPLPAPLTDAAIRFPALRPGDPLRVTVTGPSCRWEPVDLVIAPAPPEGPPPGGATGTGGAVQLGPTRFPTRPDGSSDRSRPDDRIPLPSTVWQAALAATGLGWRLRDFHQPWGWTACTLHNSGPSPVDVVVRMRIVDDHGAPAHAFRPRLRDAMLASGDVAVTVRVPPDSATEAVLPVYVDEAALQEDVRTTWWRQFEVQAIGDEAAQIRREPLYVQRGSTPATIGALAGALASSVGLTLVALRGRRWLDRQDTATLTLTAMLSGVAFVAAAAAQLLGVLTAAVLGPFGMLVTALIDEGLQTAVLATLLTLRPRPGIAALSTVVVWLLRAVAFGTFGPFELLILSSRVALLEGALWAAGALGATRQARGRLTAALVFAQLASTAIGFAWSSVLWRMFFADWYVVLMLLGPGLLYPWIAVRIADPVARSLAEVSP